MIYHLIATVTSTTVYCVKPMHDGGDLDCANSSHVCEDLHFYASNISHYFTSDTTLEFLPGEHQLTGLNVSISNVSNLQLTGETVECTPSTPHLLEKAPQISCSGGEAGFIFQDMVNLTLSHLSISHCGQPVPMSGPTPSFAGAALAFSNIENIVLHSVAVFNTSGHGFLMNNIYGRSTVRDCHLQHNRGSVEYTGGNVHINYLQCPPEYTRGGIVLMMVSSTFMFGGYDGNYADSEKTGVFATGVSLTLSCTNVTVLVRKVTMDGNSNDRALGYGGNMFIHFYNETGLISNNVHISNSSFFNGNAWVGGGLGVSLYIGASGHTQCDNKVSITDSTFLGNLALSGAGVYIDYQQQLLNNNCTAEIKFTNSLLSSNVVSKKELGVNVGVAMTILNEQLSGVSITNPNTFSVHFNNITVEYNTLVIPDYQRLTSGSAALYIENFPEHLIIEDSCFQHNNITGLAAFHSHVRFHGETTFWNNTGVRGGGLIACESTNIILTPNTAINFLGNHAQLSGGGIYAEEQCANSVPLCFYQIDTESAHCGSYNNVSQIVSKCRMRINMINNTADFAGSHIYGGSIDKCYFHIISKVFKPEDFRAVFKLKGPSTDLSRVSSDPKLVCFCQNSTTKICSEEVLHYPDKVYPGEAITVYAIIVGQLNGSVPGLIRVNTSQGQTYTLHDTGLNCTAINIITRSCGYSNVTYKFEVFVSSSNVSPNFSIGKSKYLHVGFKQCPSGYKLNKMECKCDCHDSWRKIECDFEKMELTRHPPAWLGFVGHDFVHQRECPYDYCSEVVVQLKLVNGTFDSDKQCSPHRVGMLCGKCEEGFSLSASSSACLNCTDHPSAYLAGYITGRLLIGVGLILLLTACNWTITSGTTATLLFYANVFKMNSFIFLPHRFNALTILLSWMNLDFYFTQCLYNGLDSYMKSWLAFVFPMYLLALVAAIVFLSRRFSCVAKLFAGNTVKILATLIELSYAGLAQAVVTALSPIRITVASNQHMLLWFYDGNIQFLQLKHFVLFLVGIVFGILILAHTFVLLFVQPLQRHSNLRCFSWVAKLKPLIDAYTSPHVIKDHCRYWPGLLLLVRLLLILTFALNTKRSVDVNLKAISTSCLLLLTVSSGIYKKTHLNVLNSFSIINLGVLSVFAISKSGHTHVFVSYLSASITVATMFCVLVCHTFERLRTLYQKWRMKKVLFMRTPFDAGSCSENSDLLPQLRE